jgi:hypothetical protein
MSTSVSWRGPRIAGLVLLALGVAALAATTQIHSARDGWSVSGPRFVPLIASVAVIGLALGYLLRTAWRPDLELARFAAAESEQTHWATPAAMLAALVGYVALLTPAGWALATAASNMRRSSVFGSLIAPAHPRRTSA